MTHDELLAKINAEGEFLVQHFDAKAKVHEALRVVVELHKPKTILCPDGFWGENCCVCNSGWTYPCRTIQAIEEELE